MRIRRPGTNAIVQRALKAFGNNFGVALPGLVQSYDPETETAVVTPAVGRLVPAEDNEDEDEVEYLPDLPSVPVLWFRARGVSVVGELQKDDPVLLICCDRDIAAWRRSGGISEPDTAKLHHWHGAIAIPGIEPDEWAFPVPSDAAALASRVEAELEALRSKLDALTLAFNAHIHLETGASTEAPTAVPGSIPAVVPAAVGQVDSARIKLDS